MPSVCVGCDRRRSLFSFGSHDAWMSGADWSPDGKRVLSTGYDGTVRVSDPDTGTEMLVLAVRGTAWDAAWSPNGERIVTGDESGHAAGGLAAGARR